MDNMILVQRPTHKREGSASINGRQTFRGWMCTGPNAELCFACVTTVRRPRSCRGASEKGANTAEVHGDGETEDTEPCSFTVSHTGSHCKVGTEECRDSCKFSKTLLWLPCEERNVEEQVNTKEDFFKPVPLISVKLEEVVRSGYSVDIF